MDEPADLVRSVSRALRVLEEVGHAHGPIPVKAIARRARLNLESMAASLGDRSRRSQWCPRGQAPSIAAHGCHAGWNVPTHPPEKRAFALSTPLPLLLLPQSRPRHTGRKMR